MDRPCVVGLRHADQGQDLLREEDDDAARQSQKALTALGGVVALDGQAHLDNAPGHKDDAHGFDQAEDKRGQIVDDGDGVCGKGRGDKQRPQQHQDREDAVNAPHTALGRKMIMFHVRFSSLVLEYFLISSLLFSL